MDADSEHTQLSTEGGAGIDPARLDGALKAMTSAIDRVSETAAKGMSDVLIAGGVVIASLALLGRLFPLTRLETGDVVAALAFSLALVVTGWLICYVEYRGGLELMRHQIWTERQWTEVDVDSFKTRQGTKRTIKSPIMNTTARRDAGRRGPTPTR